MKMKMKLGSISHGTLRSEDLIEAFASELARVPGHARLVRKAEQVLERADEREMSEFLGEELFEAMERLAPPFAYFAASEGDGSDFGYWPDLDALERAARCKDEVVKVRAGEPWPTGLPASVRLVMEVNERGNVALRYRANGREVWSVV
jgi:hypothetical protein